MTVEPYSATRKTQDYVDRVSEAHRCQLDNALAQPNSPDYPANCYTASAG